MLLSITTLAYVSPPCAHYRRADAFAFIRYAITPLRHFAALLMLLPLHTSYVVTCLLPPHICRYATLDDATPPRHADATTLLF